MRKLFYQESNIKSFLFDETYKSNVNKEQIFEAVWNESYIEGDKALMVHIRHLREN